MAGFAGTSLLAACGQSAAPSQPTVAPATGSTSAPAPTQAAAAPTTAPPAATPTTAAQAAAAPTTAAQPRPTAATTGGNKLEGQIVISLNTVIPDQAQQALSAAYQKVQPDVKLVFENVPGGAGVYPTWLGTQVAAGNIRPDIVSGNYFSTYRGYFNFDKVRDTTNPYTGNPWGKDLNWDFFVARNAKGERYMLPTRAVHTMWFYNKQMFGHVGVKPPTTWTEFVDVCQLIKNAGITPVSANFIYQVNQWLAEIYFDQYHVDWVNTVRAQPGDWDYDPDLDGHFAYNPNDPNIHNKYTYNVQRYYQGLQKGTLRYDTDKMASIIKNMAEIFPKYATSDMFVITDQYLPFLQQQVAIMCNGTWSLPTLNQDMQQMTPERLKALKLPDNTKVKAFEWGTFENPPMEGAGVASPVRSVESATGEYVSIIDKNQTQTDTDVNFCMFWLSKIGYPSYLQGWLKSGNFTPGGPLMINGVEDPPDIQKLFQGIKFLGNAETNYNDFLIGGKDYHAFDIYKDALQGNITPTDFGKKLEALVKTNWTDILKKAQLSQDDIDNPAKQPGT